MKFPEHCCDIDSCEISPIALQAREDLRNTIRPTAVKKCKAVILDTFCGSSLPFEKVVDGKKTQAKVKPHKASWGIGTTP